MSSVLLEKRDGKFVCPEISLEEITEMRKNYMDKNVSNSPDIINNALEYINASSVRLTSEEVQSLFCTN